MILLPIVSTCQFPCEKIELSKPLRGFKPGLQRWGLVVLNTMLPRTAVLRIPEPTYCYQPTPGLNLDTFLFPDNSCTENSRTNLLLPAHFRTKLGHISLFRHHIQQFPLPYHTPALDHGQIPLIEPPPIPARPSLIQLKFPGCQVTALTTQAFYSPLLVNPPPHRH